MLDINTNSSTSGIQNKLGPVVQRVISADTGLNFNLCFFSLSKRIFSDCRQKELRRNPPGN